MLFSTYPAVQCEGEHAWKQPQSVQGSWGRAPASVSEHKAPIDKFAAAGTTGMSIGTCHTAEVLAHVLCWQTTGHPQCSLCGTANTGWAGPAAQMHCLKHSSGHQLTEQSCPALLAQAHLFLLQKTFQLSFSQIPPALEASIPLIVVYINKYEVSAWFSSIHLLAKDKL